LDELPMRPDRYIIKEPGFPGTDSVSKKVGSGLVTN
jgi:hypothetical protein